MRKLSIFLTATILLGALAAAQAGRDRRHSWNTPPNMPQDHGQAGSGARRGDVPHQPSSQFG